MKLSRILIALVVLVSMLSVAALGSAGGLDNLNPEGLPIVKEKVTLRAFGMSYPGQVKWEEMPFFIELEERTNVHIEWEYLEPSTQATERINLMFASGELPDLFIRAGGGSATNRASVIKWGEAGLVLDLAPYLDEYAPNIKAMFDTYEAARVSNVTADGKVYLLPTIYDYTPYLVWRTMQINTRWLENVGKEVPTTLDEFTDVLRAFRDGDPNGNGDATDEVPYSAHNITVCTRGILPAFGLSFAYGYPATWTEEEGFKFQLGSDEYKAALEYLKLLYDENLLDNEIFSQTSNRFHGMLPDNRYGVVLLHQTLNAGDVAPDLTGMEPLIGPAGEDNRPWNFYNPVVYNSTSSFVTTACEQPEVAIRWLDYLYSQEGADLTWLGIEGVTYEEKADGTFAYTDMIANDPKGFSAAMGAYSIIWGNGVEPGVFTARQLEPGLSLSTVIQNTEKVEPFLQELTTVSLPILSSADQQRYNFLNSELETYVNEMRAKFITSEIGFDQWDAYVAQLEKLNIGELETFIKDATGL